MEKLGWLIAAAMAAAIVAGLLEARDIAIQSEKCKELGGVYLHHRCLKVEDINMNEEQ